MKNGPKNPPSDICLPPGFPAGFDEGEIDTSSIRFPQYDSNIIISGHKLKRQVVARSGWSSRSILEEFIAAGFQPVKDSKGQKTVFEITRSGAIEAVKVREQEKGHFTSVLRGFGTTNQMRLFLQRLGLAFDYPKPVGLIAHLIRAFSNESDWVLDSFAGSGTTGHAVMKVNKEDGTRRKFLLVEVSEETALNVIVPRLRAVIDGNTEGELEPHGGGFRYYRLAPSLLEVDSFGNLVISKQYNAAMLAQAMCKLMGFTYAPSEEVYWQQGHSTENDFIYVTTQTMTRDHLAALSEEVGKKRSLLICCSAFRGKADAFHNLTLKKIPSAVLHKCEWGHDDYSLNVANLPQAPETKPTHPIEDASLEPKHARRRKAKPDSMPSLFGNSDEGGTE